jgi:hypothetical protein
MKTLKEFVNFSSKIQLIEINYLNKNDDQWANCWGVFKINLDNDVDDMVIFGSKNRAELEYYRWVGLLEKDVETLEKLMSYNIECEWDTGKWKVTGTHFVIQTRDDCYMVGTLGFDTNVIISRAFFTNFDSVVDYIKTTMSQYQ